MCLVSLGHSWVAQDIACLVVPCPAASAAASASLGTAGAAAA